ncbi:MAG: DUF4349 domain-containing protein [Oscillospiraceae bacterium]|nr:DUF4349 domain-containing protein [Oscillospiraceae bacterium]
MKNTKKIFALLLALLCAVSMLSACGATAPEADRVLTETTQANSSHFYNKVSKEESAIEFTDDAFLDSTTTESAGTNTESSLQLGKPDPTRKLIYYVNYTLETKTFDDSVAKLLALTDTLGGYTESSETRGGNGSERYSTYVLRIPAEKLQDFISSVGTIGSIQHESLSSEDVTLEYVDVEAQLTTLRAKETRLTELLEQAETLEDVLKIEDSLNSVRYEIESATSQLNTMASLVNYSTVTINLHEVIEYTPIVKAPLTFGEKLSLEFSRSIERVWDGFQNFTIWFLGNIVEIVLVLTLIAAVVLVNILIVKLIIRRTRRQK